MKVNLYLLIAVSLPTQTLGATDFDCSSEKVQATVVQLARTNTENELENELRARYRYEYSDEHFYEMMDQLMGTRPGFSEAAMDSMSLDLIRTRRRTSAQVFCVANLVTCNWNNSKQVSSIDYLLEIADDGEIVVTTDYSAARANGLSTPDACNSTGPVQRGYTKSAQPDKSTEPGDRIDGPGSSKPGGAGTP